MPNQATSNTATHLRGPIKELTTEESVGVRQAILPILFDQIGGVTEAVGTCWIFSSHGRSALAFTAAHVVDEIIRREGRHERHAPDMPSVFRSLRPPSIDLQFTRVIAPYQVDVGNWVASHIAVTYRDGLHDVAVCVLAFGPEVPPTVAFNKKIELATGPVEFGQKVKLCGYPYLAQSTFVRDPNSDRKRGTLNPMVHFAEGTVVEDFSKGRPMGPPGPCFEVDVDVPHGMSGGPVLLGKDGPAVACGLISRGNLFAADGRIVASHLWPAYALELDSVRDESDQQISLMGLVRAGHVVDHSNGPDHFLSLGPVDGGGLKIGWKTRKDSLE